ncbi:uncharacterized protein J3R85_016278 [Psidium guajava]|nr:uncharacterized protein J3R85_016278 [Psidium guajava]
MPPVVTCCCSSSGVITDCGAPEVALFRPALSSKELDVLFRLFSPLSKNLFEACGGHGAEAVAPEALAAVAATSFVAQNFSGHCRRASLKLERPCLQSFS